MQTSEKHVPNEANFHAFDMPLSNPFFVRIIQPNFTMGEIHITYDIMDPVVYYIPQSSQTYFASFTELFLDILRQDVLPTIMVLVKLGVLQRVFHWSNILLEFYKLRQYLGYLRKTIAQKMVKAETRARVQDLTNTCRACQELFGSDSMAIFYQVRHAVVDQAREHFINGIMLPGGIEQSVITSFTLAAQRINAYQLQISNYEMADVEYNILSTLGKTMEVIDKHARAHLIIAFLTNTIYIICLLRL